PTAAAPIGSVAGPAVSATSLFAARPAPGATAVPYTSLFRSVTVRDAEGNERIGGGDDVFLSTDLGSLSSITDHADGSYTATLTSAPNGSPTAPASLSTRMTAAASGTAPVGFVAGAADADTST